MNWEKILNSDLIWCLIPIVWIIACSWCKIARIHADNELRRDMLSQGMSSEDIERVLKANSRPTKDDDVDD